jgi:hypothetical protein
MHGNAGNKTLPNVPQALLQTKRRIPNISFMHCIPNDSVTETYIKVKKHKTPKSSSFKSDFLCIISKNKIH